VPKSAVDGTKKCGRGTQKKSYPSFLTQVISAKQTLKANILLYFNGSYYKKFWLLFSPDIII
jgi:hypothetical protein